MRLILTIVGALAVVMGGIWMLQGLNILPGSFMTGDTRWTLYGGILAVIGLGVIFYARRR
jgi:hypothetical protein